MRRLGVGATARASFYLYNDEADVDALVDALADADRLFLVKVRRLTCPASKTSTARSSSTTTATRATGASCRPRRASRVEGFNPLCGDEIVVYLDVDGDGRRRRRPHRRARAARSASPRRR